MAKEQLLTVKIAIDPYFIYNAFVGAFEGGSNYWLHSAELLFSDYKKDPGDKRVWYGDSNLYKDQFFFKVGYDDPNMGEGNGKGERRLSYPEDIIKGLELMAEKSPGHFADLVSDQDDATTHDVLMQYIVLGDYCIG